MRFLFICLVTLTSSALSATLIHPNGYWDKMTESHLFDTKLADALTEFFQKENAQTIVDFGCGTGDYIKRLMASDFECEGYDGNPDTPQLSSGVASVLDLSQPFLLGKQFDWVLSLEVGEHIPRKYEQIFIENLHQHNIQGIVLSWAVRGQGGNGHFNEQNNSYIKKKMKRYGYINDVEAENFLRKHSSLPWFKNTIMVFRKVQQTQSP